jgi:glycine cleavage system aminomethyltransferase T
VKRKLVGILFTGNCPSATLPVPLIVDGQEVGTLTSCSPYPVKGRHVGLGVVRSDKVHEGDSLSVGNTSARGIAITTPLLLHNI